MASSTPSTLSSCPTNPPPAPHTTFLYRALPKLGLRYPTLKILRTLHSPPAFVPPAASLPARKHQCGCPSQPPQPRRSRAPPAASSPPRPALCHADNESHS